MIFIYILKLENNKYYIGKTNSPYFRIEDHLSGSGSVWTNKYKPLELIDIFKGDDYDENKYTQIYMDKYDIENVRGGSFCSVNLKKEEHKLLNKMSNGTNNKCYKCFEYGHFANNCSKVNNIICYKCGKTGHYSNNCYAKSDIDKNYLCQCYKCGHSGHYSYECFAKTDVYGHDMYSDDSDY